MSDDSDDEKPLTTLYEAIDSGRCNEAERVFLLAWEAVLLINGDGFEILFEQIPPIEQYAASFRAIGLPGAADVFTQVLAVIDPGLRKPGMEEQLEQALQKNAGPLKELAYEFYDATDGVTAALYQYVRDHAEAFGGHPEASALFGVN